MATGAHNRIDLVGRRFGRLVVLSYSNMNPKRAMWRCDCDCGSLIVIDGHSLRKGLTLSCGCLRADILRARNVTHGCSGRRFYSTYRDMMNRCYSANNKHFKDYGGRGIVVCEEWRGHPDAFISWCELNASMRKRHTLDRYPDMNGPYAPNNCKVRFVA